MIRRMMVVTVAISILLSPACLGGGLDVDDDPTATASPDHDPGPTTGLTGPTMTAAPTVTPDIAATAQAVNCDVTEPSLDPAPNFAGNPIYPVWYQQNDIWVAPTSASGVNPTLPPQTGSWYAGKLPVVVIPPDPEAMVDISGQMPEAPDQVLGSDIRNVDPQRGVAAILDIPTPGCWTILVSTGTISIEIVAYVLPFEARPDVAAAIHTRETTTPYPVPQTCAAAEWVLADPGATLGATYWLMGDGMSASLDPPGLLWAGEENRVVWSLATWADLEISGQLAADPSVLLRSSLTSTAGIQGNRWVSTLVFPEPGCWQITGSSVDDTLETTVYVYPAECQRQPAADLPSSCRPPGA